MEYIVAILIQLFTINTALEIHDAKEHQRQGEAAQQAYIYDQLNHDMQINYGLCTDEE